MGAENLLGQGDMLFLPPGTAYPQRVHGAFASDEEVHRVVEYLKQFGEPDYVDDILSGGGSEGCPASGAAATAKPIRCMMKPYPLPENALGQYFGRTAHLAHRLQPRRVSD